MSERNVLGGELAGCGIDPLTGWTREGTCTVGPDGDAVHLVCAVVTGPFLAHQRATGNDLVTPLPEVGFPGLVPGDRWCVVAARWAQAYSDGAAAPVVLAATNARVLELVPLAWLQEHAVDVPDTPAGL